LRIIVNGETTETRARTLEELCAALGYDSKMKVATALNGDFVPALARENTQLNEDDAIEIVAPRQGG
jgi:sulfur carrier protein